MPCLSLKHVQHSRAISKQYHHRKKLAKKAIALQKSDAKKNAKTAPKAPQLTRSPRPSRISEASIQIPHPGPHTLPAHPSRADLINAESRLGSTIFGPVPAGHRREFFHDQENIWIWHEDWSDITPDDGQTHSHQLTVRYEVRTSGVYKKVSAGSYFKLEGEELENFRRATHAYLHVIKTHLYNRPAHTAS